MFYKFLNADPYNVFRLHVVDYPTPININYFWGFGFLSATCLLIQIVTGICLAMHYVPNASTAFMSVEHVVRDVNFGWLLRYLHANGASLFFLVVYIHIGKGLYFKSYRNLELWFSGIIIFFVMMATAFMGYVLPWGQMSFWGATVITSLFSAIPIVGNNLTVWLWGGFSVDNATLTRFFSLHYLLPFVIVGLVFSHLALLHTKGSTNPLGTWFYSDYIKLYPYFFIKDFYTVSLFLFIFIYFLFFYPNYLGHSDNYIVANAMVTPPSIVPEWYFLPFYAVLRSVPNKLGGVIFMFLSIAILFLLPFIPNSRLSTRFSVISKFWFWFFVFDVILLGWLGGQAAEEPYIFISRLSTIFYFFYFVSGIISYFVESLVLSSLNKKFIFNTMIKS